MNEERTLQLISELEKDISKEDSDASVTFTVQLQTWFKLNYERESIRIQYQLMVEMGRRTNTDPNLKSVIDQYGIIKDELGIMENLMEELLHNQTESETKVKLVETHHYHPSTGISYKVPDGLKKRLMQDSAADSTNTISSTAL